MLAELAQDHATVSVHPGPLGPEGTAQLVRHRLGDNAHERFIAACHRTTAGNPLLLRQLLRALQVEGIRPDAVARRHRQRHRVTRGLQHGADAAEAAARRVHGGRPRRLGAGRRRRAAGRRRPGPARRGARPRPPSPSSPAPRSSGWTSRSGSCTRWSTRPSTRTSRPESRELAHERAARVLIGLEASARAGGRPPPAGAPPRQPGGGRCPAAGGRDRRRAWCRRRRQDLPPARDIRAAARRGPARPARRAGPPRDDDRRPGCRGEPEGGVRHPHRPDPARARSPPCSPARSSSRAGRARRPSSRGPRRPTCPRSSSTSGKGCTPSSASPGTCTACRWRSGWSATPRPAARVSAPGRSPRRWPGRS